MPNTQLERVRGAEGHIGKMGPWLWGVAQTGQGSRRGDAWTAF